MKTHLLVLLSCGAALTLPIRAADWPQWQGPDRSNVSKETGLLKNWPNGGPQLVWTFENAGIGYSGPAIAGERLYTMGARDKKEYLFALDVKTGQEVWATEVGTQFVNGWGDGPRCTPAVDGPCVYAIGGQGDIVCLEAASGKKLWQKSMEKDLKGQLMSSWGYTESPLVDGDKVLLSPGGESGTIAALSKKTGEVLWRSKELTDQASYSSIIAAEVGGLRHVVQLTGKGIAGVAASDGKLLWYHPQSGYRTAVIPTPIFANDHVYATSDYGAGCDLLKLTHAGGTIAAASLYSANKNMQNHHGGVVLVGEHIYGWTGNSNARGRWICQEMMTGKVVWEEERALDAGSLTCADGLLYCYRQKDGTVVLVEASPGGWKERGRSKIPRETKIPRKQGKIWTHPVVANGKLYLRDQDLIFCFDIREASTTAEGP